MRIQFCGANRTVTGSCHLLEINGLRVLLDLGMFQGPREEARQFNRWLPDNTLKADAIILSHGHLDHCGKLPVATRAGYSGPIYCTPATAEVARIVLMDSAHIQQEDADYLNRRVVRSDEPKIQALYTEADVQLMLKRMQHVDYGQRTDLGKGVSFTFQDAGHILGSCYVIIEWDEAGQHRRLLFTADIGRYNTPIIRDPQPLDGPVDYVITESTYGNTRHAPMDQVEPQFLEAVKACIAKGSRLLIPSFAVGRTQTVLWYMQRFVSQGLIPEIPIFVDSPMGVEASNAYSQFRDSYDEETLAAIGKRDLFGLSRVTFASSMQDSKKINSVNGACVIIASSPTCEFGRILHHLKESVERPNDMVIFVGYTPGGTLGRRLQEGQRRVRILDRFYDLKCQVKTIHGLSAHADSEELLKFLAPTLVPQTTVHVVHGEADRSEGFAVQLLQRGAGRVSVPATESSFVSLTGGIMQPSVQATASDE